MSVDNWRYTVPQSIRKILNGNVTEQNVLLPASLYIIHEHLNPCDKIVKELHSAEKYLMDYIETGDAEFLQAAEDDLSHARKPLIEAKEKLQSADTKEAYHYGSMLSWHDFITDQIARYKSQS